MAKTTKSDNAKEKGNAGPPPPPPPQPQAPVGPRPTPQEELVHIVVSPTAKRLLKEMTLGHKEPKSIDEEVDIVLDYFLYDLLMNNVNPDQLHEAVTYEDRAELAIALLKAMRGVEGYRAETKFGPYVICISEDEKEKIRERLKESKPFF